MSISSFFYKLFATCLVLVAALSIVGWIGISEIWAIVALIGIIGGVALVLAIIFSIWDN